MKTWILALSLSAMVAGLNLFVACTPQDRNNQFDPGGTAFTNSQSLFAGTNIVFSGYDLGGSNVVLTWPSASGISTFSIYLSTNGTRPATALMANVTGTNTAVPLLAIGSNFIWIEAGSTSNFISGLFLVPSGWNIDPAEGFSSPSLRCVNIPFGQTKTISFPANIMGSATAPTFVGSWIRTRGTAGNLEITIEVTNNLYRFAWTNQVGDLPIFSSISGMPGGNMPSTAMGHCIIAVKNVGDNNGFNACWIDEPYIQCTTIIAFSNSFSGMAQGDLFGDKEK
jgi:hypothetical protein